MPSSYLKAKFIAAIALLIVSTGASTAWIATFGSPLTPPIARVDIHRFYQVCDHFKGLGFRVPANGDIYTFHRPGTPQTLSLQRHGIYATTQQISKVNAFLTGLSLPTLPGVPVVSVVFDPTKASRVR